MENQNDASRTSAKVLPDSLLCRKCGELSEEDKRLLSLNFVARLGFPKRLWECQFDGRHGTIEGKLLKLSTVGVEFSGVVLAGLPGRGKSAALVSMAKAFLISRFYSPQDSPPVRYILNYFLAVTEYIHYRDFSAMIRDSLKKDSEQDLAELMETWKRPTLLIIDDMMDGNVTDWDLQQLGEIIDYRYSNMKPTWITTNISAKDLSVWPGFERSYSRLADKSWCLYFEFKGPDYRRNP